nr:Chain A, Wasabi Receptor Toxin [Urodacus manicatus]
ASPQQAKYCYEQCNVNKVPFDQCYQMCSPLERS